MFCTCDRDLYLNDGMVYYKGENMVDEDALFYVRICMIVPFQMVMFPMSKIVNMLGLDNPIGIIIVYLGFGAGLRFSCSVDL